MSDLELTEAIFRDRTREASQRLLELLAHHHDYRVPYQPKPAEPERIEFVAPKEPTDEFKNLWFGVPEPIEAPEPIIPKMTDIKRAICKHFNVSLTDLMSVRRDRKVCRPRQVAMYLCKEYTNRSLPEIGRGFGGRDHTTALHAVRKVKSLCLTNPVIAHDVAHLEARFAP